MSLKPKLIYILSNGRSGSTLLDLILGSHPQIWTLGELQVLPWEVKENRAPCGCGKEVTKCDYWSKVLEDLEVGEEGPPIEHFREKHGAGKVVRVNILPELYKGESASYRKDEIRRYGEKNCALLERALNIANGSFSGDEVRWLVDASKDPYRLFWLRQSGLFDIRVIHITKSPCGFVYSMIRNRTDKLWRATIRMTGRWIIENEIMYRLTNSSFEKTEAMHIKYEDLANSPDDVCKRVQSWLGLGKEFPGLGLFRASENHAVSGAQIRWDSSAIKLDERWKHELSFTKRLFVKLFCYIPSKRYGY